MQHAQAENLQRPFLAAGEEMLVEKMNSCGIVGFQTQL